MHLRREETTLPKLLRTAGYATCHVGKWHLNGLFGSAEQPQPGDHGFDYWFSTQNNAAPSHENPDNFIRNGEKVGQLQGYSCQLVADEAIGWLERRTDREQPFFLFVCFHEPHEPIASPAELVSEYPQATKRGQALYYANVTNMDRAVGRLMASLDRLKLADQTLVYFSSDNGPETLDRYPGAWRSHGSAAPLRDRKLYMYEGGIRVPGIARWPGHIKPGQEIHEPVCSLDLLPTFCALSGAQVPDSLKLDGADIRPLLAGESFERPTPLYWHYFQALGQPKATMRVGNYAILAHSDKPNQRPASGMPPGAMQAMKSDGLKDFELYDLAQDLGQRDDLAQRQPERVKELSERLLAKYREIQAQMPVWPDWQPKNKGK